MSSMSRLFINIDAQDAQNYLARGFNRLEFNHRLARKGGVIHG